MSDFADYWRRGIELGLYDEQGNTICQRCRGSHRTVDHPTEPDYIVVRPAPDLPDGFLPPHLDGKWFNRSDVPMGRHAPGEATGPEGVTVSEAVAVPTDRFEVREDGAVAQVWEMRP